MDVPLLHQRVSVGQSLGTVFVVRSHRIAIDRAQLDQCECRFLGEGGNLPRPARPPDHSRGSGSNNKVFKSGPLFLSSKGIGWTSWKKRWFILTRTSLVFFRSDPVTSIYFLWSRTGIILPVARRIWFASLVASVIVVVARIFIKLEILTSLELHLCMVCWYVTFGSSAIPQKGSEVNLTLGGIDLNNSGSVVVKVDKKLLTVLFPDGRDGRAFTLKAETLEDLYEWKAALEEALALAPSATLVMGQNGIFRNDQADTFDVKDRQPVKSLVIGRPILLALEDIDGTPSFLEKALRFVEEHGEIPLFTVTYVIYLQPFLNSNLLFLRIDRKGVKVEGILRQAAYVDDVERRIREYEQGKNDFSSEEDAHVIADCVKYVLRELPSSPVPASCCNALLETCRTDRGRRVAAMREAICETFPEPNRRLLQRILKMMQTVASHKTENRMSSSAVAACMAPLLLRPLLSGDCELENDFDVGGDGSMQLLQAAAAANHAQAIVITLLEEYEDIFGEGSLSSELYSESEDSESDSEELTDDDGDGTEGSDSDIDEDSEHASDETNSETGKIQDNGSNGPSLCSKCNQSDDDRKANQKSSSSSPQSSSAQHDNVQRSEDFSNQSDLSSAMQANQSGEILEDNPAETSSEHKLIDNSLSSCIQNSTSTFNEPVPGAQRPSILGCAPAKEKPSMESVDLPYENEAEIERLENIKIDLQNRIAEEAKVNALLQASLETRKNALHERRLALEQDVARLQEQLQKERELRAGLEDGLKMPQGSLPTSTTIGEKTKAELEEIARVEGGAMNVKQKTDKPEVQLNQQHEHGFVYGSYNQPQQTPNNQVKLKEKEDIETAASLRIPERSTRNKDAQWDKADSGKEMKPDISNKHLPQNQQLDTAHYAKSIGVPPATKSATELGGNSTSSAMSKITSRLNFLKERRYQIANELQNLNKGQSSGPPGKGSESRPSVQNQDKFQSVNNSEKGLGWDNRQNIDIGVATEGRSVENVEQLGKSDGRSLQNLHKGRSEGQSVANLEKGKSESFPNADKGRRSEGRPIVAPRTFSR
ncbi:hypothetical protein HYC85_008211 [Camellia sinensis]|uniref:Rho-GAP domain-containing protein n=1 Tax=Camellia sinensis TaxID=4442 RepID=A0A7J7HS15_CAMSI|nr:hypothetical protein HYC85_008211 [Camellia sinensis]